MAHQTPSKDLKGKAQDDLASTDLSTRQQLAAGTLRYFATTVKSSSPYISPYAQPVESRKSKLLSLENQQSESTIFPYKSRGEGPLIEEAALPAASSASSSSSRSSSVYSSPESQYYPLATSRIMSTSKNITATEKAQLIRSLQTHKVNTLTELRRIEKTFASVTSADATEAMTDAWAHYVNSNNLLSELRALTKNYPFSSECLDEAKWQVISDPASTRSWNYCWLVLTKIRKEGLIAKHARLLAVKPAMWGGRTPTAAGVEKLATACVAEWTRALDQMLRNWTSPPSLTGR